jgi:hypothetical protein
MKKFTLWLFDPCVRCLETWVTNQNVTRCLLPVERRRRDIELRNTGEDKHPGASEFSKKTQYEIVQNSICLAPKCSVQTRQTDVTKLLFIFDARTQVKFNQILKSQGNMLFI